MYICFFIKLLVFCKPQISTCLPTGLSVKYMFRFYLPMLGFTKNILIFLYLECLRFWLGSVVGFPETHCIIRRYINTLYSGQK